ncbi:MAG: hypothetical protein Q7U02_14350 [Desulfosalsimonadaceae bacterium]|nr:hypothetical protein [Desulfosalsimonadaceae bacterium]
MNEISDAKLKAFILVGTMGLIVIISAKLIGKILHKGVNDGIKLIGFHH